MKAQLSDQIEKYVREAYTSDTDLVSKWHVTAGDGLEKCIKRTIADLNDLNICPGLSFFVVTEGDAFVGYFGLEYDGTYMPTIFIHPKFRDRKDEFWKLIQDAMEPVWRAGIYTKNTPCMKFYAKQGKEIARLQTPHGEAALFQFKRSG